MCRIGVFDAHGGQLSMTADECHGRASQCAENARLAASEQMALEFVRLAAQWRAMAGRTIFLGSVAASSGVLPIGVPQLPPA